MRKFWCKNAASYVATVIPQYQNRHFTMHSPVAILIVKIKVIVLYFTMNNGGWVWRFAWEQAEEIIASGKADIVAMAKSFMADGDIVRKSLRGQQAEIRPCTRCDLCGNANTWGTNMICAINPRCGVSEQIQPVPWRLRWRLCMSVMIIMRQSFLQWQRCFQSWQCHCVCWLPDRALCSNFTCEYVTMKFKLNHRHFLVCRRRHG